MEALRVEVRNLQKEVEELKEERKEDRKHYVEVFDVLKENLVQLKIIVERADERQTATDKIMEERFENIKNDIKSINDNMSKGSEQKDLMPLVSKLVYAFILLSMLFAGYKATGSDIIGLLK
ncbi:MAG: hypothetical protein K0S34_83 [Bacillales bacterium]|jgi:ABC-type Na+ efflux pump permease subunit|nr:hypothetical protein [Bacillales bacterium]